MFEKSFSLDPGWKNVQCQRWDEYNKFDDNDLELQEKFRQKECEKRRKPDRQRQL